MNLNWHYRMWNELTRDELYACLVLRIEVFVIEQCCPYMDTDDKDKSSDHLFCTDATGKVLAYLRIVHPGISFTECSIGRVVNHSSIRGTGIGRELMRRGIHAIEQKWGASAVRISAQLYLQQFYESFGFVKCSEIYDEDGLPHIQMLRPLGA
ncbi:MAG: GNAT family N-acetyltransferase [Crocinitomicaceae bacterium]|nr:GNAT family N-acetyltransferase [Crocinitomicaceae bacterium]